MHTDKTKKRAITVRTDTRLAGMIEVEAKAAGVSTGAWLRQAAELRLAGSPAVPVSDSHDEIETLARQMEGIESMAKDIMAYLQVVIPTNEEQRRRMEDIRNRMDTSSAVSGVPTIGEAVL